MKQMGLKFKFREFQEGDKVKLTEIGIQGLENYYGNDVNNRLGLHWRDVVYKIHSVVPRDFPYKIKFSDNYQVGLKKDEIEYA